MVVSLDEVKKHLRIENDEEDDLLTSLIMQAQDVAADYCRVSFGKLDEEGNEASVPEPVRLAVLLFVSHYYENRDISDHSTYTTMRIAFENLLYPYRDVSKMF